MNKISEIAKIYKDTPIILEDDNLKNNSFIDIVLNTTDVAVSAFDKLAYLAGIKNAPADDKYASLNMSNLNSFLDSAKEAGYDVEIISI